MPRQRDLRVLVGRDTPGAVVTSLFDTLKYWDGRFDIIRLDDRNLPAIVHERLQLRASDSAAPAGPLFGGAARNRLAKLDLALSRHGSQLVFVGEFVCGSRAVQQADLPMRFISCSERVLRDIR